MANMSTDALGMGPSGSRYCASSPQLPILWSQLPNTAIISDTSSIPERDIGHCLSVDSPQFEVLSRFPNKWVTRPCCLHAECCCQHTSPGFGGKVQIEIPRIKSVAQRGTESGSRLHRRDRVLGFCCH